MAVAKVERAEKLFYRINEVSRLTGIKPYVLRYWETEFEGLKPQKDVNDQRRYRKEDIDLIEKIKTLLYKERFTIAGARKHLKEMNRTSAEGNSRAEKIKGIRAELYAIRKELCELLNIYA